MLYNFYNYSNTFKIFCQILIGFTPPANSLQIAAGWKESHSYNLAFGQSVASMY